MSNMENMDVGSVGMGASPQIEKTFTQAELDAIVRHRLAQVERVKTEQPDYAAARYAAQEATNEQTRKLVAEQMGLERQKYEQEYLQKQNEAKVNSIVQQFREKKDIGSKKYTDFSEVVNENSMADYPYLVKSVMENTDNAEDVLYELAKDPERLWNFELASREPSGAGLKILKKFSSDLKKKETVVEEEVPATVNNFIRKLSSSPNVAPSKNAPSVEDLKKIYRF